MTLLADALKRTGRDVDTLFDALLPLPEDGRARLIAAMRHAAIGGGKRLRPLLVAASAGLYGVDPHHALRAGAAIEAIHVYSLIHDDLPCMDDDDLRRGRPTVHKAFDEATAVLAGDALQSLAFEILSDPQTSGDPFTRAELVTVLAQASGVGGMAGGQMLDIAGEGQQLDIPAITRMQQLKTGALLAAAVEMGAVLGKVPPEGRVHLRGYARDIGLAFQIADDLIDHGGDAQRVGKAVGKDAASGKQTFVAAVGAERARGQAEMLVDQAVAHLAAHGHEADLLREIAHYVVKRDR